MRKFVSILVAAIVVFSVVSPSQAGDYRYQRQGNNDATVALGALLMLGGVAILGSALNQNRRQPAYANPYYGQRQYGLNRHFQPPRHGGYRWHQPSVRCAPKPHGTQWRDRNQPGRIGSVPCSDGADRYYYYPGSQ